MNALIVINPNGQMQFVYDDDLTGLLELGESNIRRASHVEPSPAGWVADLSPVAGPNLGPFKLRKDALAAEMDYLENVTLQGNSTI